MKSIEQIAKEFNEQQETCFSRKRREQRRRGVKSNSKTQAVKKLMKDK